MSTNKTILVGTVGQGVMRSEDNGDSWRRIGIDQGLHSDALVRALLASPGQAGVVFAGTDKGLYRSGDSGGTWSLIDAPMSGYCVWALAVDPHDPRNMYAGTGTPNPAALFRSNDGGVNWQKPSMTAAETCPNVGVPRVTGIAVDPTEPRNVWVGLEVDGVRSSHDGGDSWQTINGAIPNLDVHNVAVTAGPPKTVVVVVNNDVYTSSDDGANWQSVDVRQNWPYGYPRGIMVQPGKPNTIFLTIGDTTPGRIGAVMRSADTGKTWQQMNLPVDPNTAMWVVNIQPGRSPGSFRRQPIWLLVS